MTPSLNAAGNWKKLRALTPGFAINFVILCKTNNMKRSERVYSLESRDRNEAYGNLLQLCRAINAAGQYSTIWRDLQKSGCATHGEYTIRVLPVFRHTKTARPV